MVRLGESILAELGVAEIVGRLTEHDKDRRAKQLRFYTYNEYEVRLDGDRGSIRKRIDRQK